MVVMDKNDYIKKTEDLLNQPTYQIIPADPTNRQKNKLINLLRNIKAEWGISEEAYKKMYPTGAGLPEVYGLPRSTNQGPPETHSFKQGHCHLLISERVGQECETASGESPHKGFFQHIEGIRLQQDVCIMSYDVKALFTSVPIGPAINAIRDKLTKDKDLQQRTSMSVNLFEFYLKNKYSKADIMKSWRVQPKGHP